MAKSIDLKLVVKHIVNGTLGKNLCRICLMPLDDLCENIFTKICKKDKDYCIANILEEICNIDFTEMDDYNVCSDCFIIASSAYKFYLLTKRTEEILQFYVNEINNNVSLLDVPEQVTADSYYISLPEFEPETKLYDYDLDGLAMQSYQMDAENIFENKNETKKKQKTKCNMEPKVKMECEPETEVKKEIELNDDVLIVMQECGEPAFFKAREDGTLEILDGDERKSYNKAFKMSAPSPIVKQNVVTKKRRRKRDPMTYKMCSKCPIKYRFVAKLKEHMKTEHNIDLFVCKVCNAIIENEQEFHNHLKTHTNTHTCAICNTVFKKRSTIIAHLRKHEQMKNMSKLEGAHVCEICGLILPDEDHLKDHYDKKHDKKYTCYYCGRMYKGEISFEMHIKKHEMHMKSHETKQQRRQDVDESSKLMKKQEREYTCVPCRRNFVDERALMWHQRLHTNERPYKCDVCGRGFVSVNRRNQHAVCAHTVPTRRCPLCPALFHLRSMVNTHIKKVHLKAHKRRNRTTKYQDVFWHTEPVPIQELSVSIQNDLLELQTAKSNQSHS